MCIRDRIASEVIGLVPARAIADELPRGLEFSYDILSRIESSAQRLKVKDYSENMILEKKMASLVNKTSQIL